MKFSKLSWQNNSSINHCFTASYRTRHTDCFPHIVCLYWSPSPESLYLCLQSDFKHKILRNTQIKIQENFPILMFSWTSVQWRNMEEAADRARCQRHHQWSRQYRKTKYGIFHTWPWLFSILTASLSFLKVSSNSCWGQCFVCWVN